MRKGIRVVIIGAGKPWSVIRSPEMSSCSADRGGSLIKALWHDGIGLSLYAKRLDVAVLSGR